MKPKFWMVLGSFTLLLMAGCGNNEGSAAQGDAGMAAQGEKIYTQRCAACHDKGLAGAPQTGNKSDWSAAIARGMDVLVEHSINGYKGERGFMPARGGHADLSDADVKAAVQYMVEKSK